MSDSKYYLITGTVTNIVRAGEFENINDVYKFLLDNRIAQGDYIIIKGERVL